jgi:DNA-binding XRE family transcriptional regulator
VGKSKREPAPKIRERLKDEQVAVASACAVDRTHIGHILAGRRKPSVQVARKISVYLGETVDDVLGALGI